MRPICIDPIISGNSKVLLLGTFPGKKSLKRREYYANKDNVFWDILFRVLKKDIDFYKPTSVEYAIKKQLLLENNIALWDVVYTCDNNTGKDSGISDPIFNDFEIFLSEHVSIRHLFFTSKSAHKFFEKSKDRSLLTQYKFDVLPSTSSSSGNNAFQTLSIWREQIIRAIS